MLIEREVITEQLKKIYIFSGFLFRKQDNKTGIATDKEDIHKRYC